MIFKTKYAINPNVDMVFSIIKNLSVNQFVSVDYLSKKLCCSTQTIKHTGKFLLLSDIIETKKGTGGGYRLQRPLDQIYLRDLTPLTYAEREVLRHAFRLSGHLSVKDFLAIVYRHQAKEQGLPGGMS